MNTYSEIYLTCCYTCVTEDVKTSQDINHHVYDIVDFYMALRTKDEWETWLQAAGLIATGDSIANYAQAFVENNIDEECLSELSRDILTTLNITNIGDTMKIMKKAKTAAAVTTASLDQASLNNAGQTGTRHNKDITKLPKLTAQMTAPQFRKFSYDWEVFKNQRNIQEDKIPGQLYNTCEESLQLQIIHSIPNFLTLPETTLMTKLKAAVTTQSNPTVYRLTFEKMTQADGQSCDEYISSLRTAAVDCEFVCSSCEHDDSDLRIRDKFIQGLQNTFLQTDILAKATTLKTLDDVIKHAKAFEAAVRDQSTIQSNNNNADSVLAAHTSSYRKKNYFNKPKFNYKQNSGTCIGCGREDHGSFNNRKANCPAWGKVCDKCKGRNHLTSLCLKKRQDTALALIAHLSSSQLSQDTDNEVKEISMVLTPDVPMHPTASLSTLPKTIHVFPDPGASISIAGPKHLIQLGIGPEDLHKCRKIVGAAGGSTLLCYGWLYVTFSIG